MAATASGVALSLEASKTSWSSLYRVRLPLQPPDDAFCGSAEGLSDALGPAIMPPPLPPLLEHRRLVLRRVQSLVTKELPFSAWLAGGYGDASIQLVCTRDVVARVFKLMKEQAAQLGLVVADLKSHVSLGLSGEELRQAAAAALQAGLAGSGWWALTSSHLLGCSPLELADGAGHTCDYLSLEYEMQEGSRMTLLAKPEVVRFRQLAATAAPGGGGGLDIAALNQKLKDSPCRVLPDLRHGLIDGVEAAAAGCQEALASLWAMHGIVLPPEAAATPYVLRVRFEEDPDAPTFLFPTCCVLSGAGLDPLYIRADQPAVQSLLARLRDDLTSPGVPFSFGALKVVEARLWHPEGQPATGQQSAAAPAGFTSARQLEQAAPAEPAFKLALGATMDLAGFSFQPAETGGPSGGGGGGCPPAKKPHARQGPYVAAMLARIAEEAEAERAAAAAKAVLQPAVKPSQAPAKPAPKRPALPGMSKSAVPAAKRKAAPAGAAPKPKAPAAAKPKAPAAPKKAKAVAAAGVAAGALGAALAAPDGAGPAGTEAGQPAAAAVAAQAAPARARAKPADVDVAEVTARVQALHAAGAGLAALTIPQLKAFLKSVGKAVGGKKAELEERARLHLSSEQ